MITAAEWDIAEMTRCATAMRKDWDTDETTGALIAAHHRGWTPCRALVVLARTMADPEGTPRDVLTAAQDPLRRVQPARPEIMELLAAEARAGITAPRPGRAA
ncbi:MAG: hypothetical protein ACRDNZ_20595 [Streptosporangiaceae bacterium]